MNKDIEAVVSTLVITRKVAPNCRPNPLLRPKSSRGLFNVGILYKTQKMFFLSDDQELYNTNTKPNINFTLDSNTLLYKPITLLIIENIKNG